MNKKLYKPICKLILIVLICCTLSSFSYGRIWGNYRECVNETDCLSQSSNQILKTYIIDSAGYFLNSHSSFQAFLNRFEISETNSPDWTELKEILYDAIQNIEKAKMAYTNFKINSEKMSYNQILIDKLVKFDYDAFLGQNGFIEPIFAKLKALLIKGNINGFDINVLFNMDNIICKLYEIKNSIDKNQMPEVALLWRTNQAYMEAQLFSQYMSEVFMEILF